MQTSLSHLLDQVFLILVNGGIVLGIFVILLINNTSGRKTRANTFLSILLAALTFSVFHLRYAGQVINHFSFRAYSLGDPTFLVIAPLLWLYILELTGKHVKPNLRTLLHFIPFLFIIFCSLTFDTVLKDSPPVLFLTQHPRLPFTFFWMIAVIQFSAYQYLVHSKWRDYQQKIRQEVSNTENVNISWIRFFMGVFLLVNFSFLFSLFAMIHLDVTEGIWKFIGIILSLSIFALGYKGILQREIFLPGTTVNLTSAAERKTNLNISDEALKRLIAFMESQKPYLDPELSLSSLSMRTNLNRNQLSQIINEGAGQNFYDFVNKYRVEEVKRLMVDPQKQNYNLLGLALEAGFKSKSTFNLIFKRFTGLTPTEYKRNIS